MKLVVATKNEGKIRELRKLLAALPLELVPADGMPEVDETGATFAENAELKARAAAEWSGEWAIADDSGLEVDVMGGGPGVHSNRWAGDDSTEASRNELLIRTLRSHDPTTWTARYRASVAIAAPDGRLWLSEGSCEGLIVAEPRGDGGFGYDPHFFVPEFGCTMAELPLETKNRISHRARALAAARSVLERLAGAS